MTPAQNIQPNPGRIVSHSVDQMLSASLSSSPTATYHVPIHSQPSSYGGKQQPPRTGAAEKQLKPFNTKDIKILLLENVNKAGQELLREQGYQVEALKTSLPEDQLIEKIR